MNKKAQEVYLRIKNDPTDFMFGMLFKLHNGKPIPIEGKSLRVMPDGIPIVVNQSPTFPNFRENSSLEPLEAIRTTQTFREISNSIAKETPFGERSVFYKKQREIFSGQISKLNEPGYWRYVIVHDYNATKLIEEFKERSLESKMLEVVSDDDYVDFIIYAEKDDHTISLGKVLLIKMSHEMVDYYHAHPANENLLKVWAAHIYKQQNLKQHKTFHFAEEEIVTAFSESIKLQTKMGKVLTVLEFQNYIKRFLDQFSSFLHEDVKFSREQWDPTLQSEEYLLNKPNALVSSVVQKCDEAIQKLEAFKRKLSIIQSFRIVGLEFETPFIGSLVKIIDDTITNVVDFKNSLLEKQDKIMLHLPYVCGIWNGLIEFVAGIVDIGVLGLNIIVDELLEDDINLEVLTLRESVEEALSIVIANPSLVFKEAIDAIQQYKYTRYDDPSLNRYQLQFHEGEDTVLAIDIIVTVVTIVKGLTKLPKILTRFSRWIEKMLLRNGKGALKVEEAIQDAKRARKKIGRVEYEILNQNLLQKYIDDAVALCKKKGIDLEIVWIDEKHPQFLGDLLGRFSVSMKNKRKLQIHLRPECPKITWFHEKKHLTDFLETGYKKYKKIHLETPWKHEESVWNYIYKNRNKWSEEELLDAYKYYKRCHDDYSVKAKIFKELEEKILISNEFNNRRS